MTADEATNRAREKAMVASLAALPKERAGDRKLRLFGVAWARLLADFFTPKTEAYVAAAELYADGLASDGDRATAQQRGDGHCLFIHADTYAPLFGGVLCDESALRAGQYGFRKSLWGLGDIHYSAQFRNWWTEYEPLYLRQGWTHDPLLSYRSQRSWDLRMKAREAEIHHAFLGRAESLAEDIFIPVRPVAFSPAWRTSAAVAVANSMYESRDFAAMPVLADALEEAGCDQPDVLAHCRGPGPHARGCWVVDLVLGKS